MRRSNGEREAIRRLVLPRPTVPAVSAARRACVRAHGIARRDLCLYTCVHACATSLHARVCVARAGGEESRASKRTSERVAGAADSLCPRKLCSPRLHVFPTPHPPSLAAASLFHPPFSARPPAPAASASLLDPRCDRISLVRSLLLPRSFLLLAALPNPYPLTPPPLSPAVSLPLDRC